MGIGTIKIRNNIKVKPNGGVWQYIWCYMEILIKRSKIATNVFFDSFVNTLLVQWLSLFWPPPSPTILRSMIFYCAILLFFPFSFGNYLVIIFVSAYPLSSYLYLYFLITSTFYFFSCFHGSDRRLHLSIKLTFGPEILIFWQHWLFIGSHFLRCILLSWRV